MKTGIYGGSFNPVHNGHIHLALSAVEQAGLDRLYFVPTGTSPHRSMSEYVSGEHRLEMLRLASEISDKFYVSDYELRNDRKSYTIYTIEEFRRLFPGDELYLLIGSDMLEIFSRWHRFRDIMKEVTVIVLARKEGDIEKYSEKLEIIRRYGDIIVCNAEPLEISSTDIRKKIKENENFSCYLDENVVKYITSNKLYEQE